MKANKLFLLASLLLSGSMIPITAQNKKEKKQQREQAVREAVDAKAYKIILLFLAFQINLFEFLFHL